MVVDYFLRSGRYATDDLMRWGGGAYWYRRGIRWQGLAAFVLGLGVSVLFGNSDLYASPLMTTWLGGTDLSFEMGMLVSGAVYFFLVRRRM